MILAILLAVATAPQTDTEVKSRYSAKFDTCMTRAASAKWINFAMLECGNAELDEHDARLNQAYKMVMSRLTRTRRTALRTSQRRWIDVRDTKCQKIHDDAGGHSASGVERLDCMISETIKRTIFFERYR